MRGLLQAGDHGEAIGILVDTRVLPSENARESHRLYELAHVGAALDELDDGSRAVARGHLETALEWPESLGQGRPFDPDERLVRFLLGVVGDAGGGPGAGSADPEGAAALRARADSLAGAASPTAVIEGALVRRALATVGTSRRQVAPSAHAGSQRVSRGCPGRRIASPRLADLRKHD